MTIVTLPDSGEKFEVHSVKLTPKVLTFEEIEKRMKSPPQTSIVYKITPEVAEAILQHFNWDNRPRKRISVATVSRALMHKDFMVTGDTIKFSDAARLVDGQNRLFACVESEKPLITHVVWGVPDEAFDRIDRGSTRSTEDIFHRAGVPYAASVAHAVRYLDKIRAMNVGEYVGWNQEPRILLQAYEHHFQGIEKYIHWGTRMKASMGYPISRGFTCFMILRKFGGSVSEAELFMDALIEGHSGKDFLTHDALRAVWLQVKVRTGQLIIAKNQYGSLIKAWNWHVEKPGRRAARKSVEYITADEEFPLIRKYR